MRIMIVTGANEEAVVLAWKRTQIDMYPASKITPTPDNYTFMVGPFEVLGPAFRSWLEKRPDLTWFEVAYGDGPPRVASSSSYRIALDEELDEEIVADDEITFPDQQPWRNEVEKLRARAPEGVIADLIDLVNHTYAHHQVAVGQLEAEVKKIKTSLNERLNGSRVEPGGGNPTPGSFEELDRLRELRDVVYHFTQGPVWFKLATLAQDLKEGHA